MKTNFKNDIADYAFHILNYFMFTVIALLCLYPFYNIFIYTISDPQQAAKGGIYFIPKGLSVFNYLTVFKLKGIAGAAAISAARTIIGTAVTVCCSSVFAFALTKKELYFRKFIYRLVVVTLYLHAGLIPWYITMRAIKLQNNFLLYILPGAVVGFYIILIKTYMEQIPPSLEESATIDGANYFIVFLKIIFPMSLPIVATIAVFSAVGQWNAWTDNFFLVRNQKLQTLQLILLNYLRESEALSRSINTEEMSKNSSRVMSLTPTAVRMTITMVATIPIIFVYPFLQRYFIKGIMLGAIKG